MEDKGLIEVYKVIFETLEKNNRIERMLQELSDKLKLSIVLVDSYGHIIAKNWMKTHEDKAKFFPDEEELWVLLTEKYFALQNGYVSRSTSSGYQILSPIKVKDNVEGFCITYQENISDENYMIEINKLISRMLAVRFKLNGRTYYLEEPAAKQILSRVLLGTTEKEECLPKLNKKIFDTYVIEPFVMAVFEVDEERVVQEQQIRKKINDCFENSLTYIEGKNLFVLFMDVKSAEQLEAAGNCVKTITEEDEVLAGISERFVDIKEISAKKKVLQRIVKIGVKLNASKKVFREYDYYQELICSYAYEEIGAYGYYSNELENLKKEDEEKGTEFCRSLKEYLLCGNNVNLAAKRMFVHRNTMVYRLGKIHEIMGVDINDPEVAQRLLWGMVLRALNFPK